MHFNQPITLNELEFIKSPRETIRFILALIALLPFGVGLVLLILNTNPFITLGIVFIYLFIAWFVASLFKANLVANALRVSSNNFPDIHNLVGQIKFELSYTKNIEVYIVDENAINAFFINRLANRFLILNSELIKDMQDGEKMLQLKWIIGRFIGAMKSKQIRLTFLVSIFEASEQLFFVNLFILPYVRATQYTGDNYGLAVCKDLKQAMIAFDKILVGNELSKKVNFKGILEQSKLIRFNFFAFITRLFSPFPHTVSRYMNLLAFAKWRYPDLFESYVKQFNFADSIEISYLLPNTYINKELQYPNQRTTITSNPNVITNYGTKPRIKIKKRFG